jgi:predicted transcriptional regulator
LTDQQLALLDILWSKGEASAARVHEAQLADLGLARKTVGTVLKRLEEYGILNHREVGREYLFRPTVSREEVRLASIRALARNLFGGSVTGLVSRALSEAEVDTGDSARIRAMLESIESMDGAVADEEPS